jgi:Flp pilus assembly protein TadG
MMTLHKEQRGAAVVEMALVTPFLILLLLGLVEFGWLFAQNLDIKHGAREAARMISLNEDPGGGGSQAGNIISDVCDRMDLFPGTSVALSRTGATVDSAATATVSVAAGGNTLTGFLDWAIPDTFVLAADVDTRLQKEATWAPGTAPCP